VAIMKHKLTQKQIKELKEELEFYRKHTKLSLCKVCRKPITSDTNKVTVVVRIRNKKIKNTWQSGAFSNRTIGTYHERCYKKC